MLYDAPCLIACIDIEIASVRMTLADADFTDDEDGGVFAVSARWPDHAPGRG